MFILYMGLNVLLGIVLFFLIWKINTWIILKGKPLQPTKSGIISCFFVVVLTMLIVFQNSYQHTDFLFKLSVSSTIGGLIGFVLGWLYAVYLNRRVSGEIIR